MADNHLRITCCRSDCAQVIWMDPDQYDKLRRTRDTFYCPAGHGQHFTGATLEEQRILELERQVKVLRQSLAYANEHAEYEQTACPWSGCDYRGASRGARHQHLVRAHGMPSLAAIRREGAA